MCHSGRSWRLCRATAPLPRQAMLESQRPLSSRTARVGCSPGMSPIRGARAADAYGADTSRLERRFKMIAASTTTNVTAASKSPATFAGSGDGL
jgi:hypothetical protein